MKILSALLFLLALSSCNDSKSGNDKNAVNWCSQGITNLSLNQSVANHDVTRGEAYCYAFKTTAGQKYTLTLYTTAGDSDLTLARDTEFSSTSRIAYSRKNGTTPERITYTAASSSTYYAEAYAHRDSSYSFIVTEGSNSPPIAKATWNNAAPLEKVNLNASTSLDANNDSLTYKWTLTSVPAGSSASLTNNSNVTTAFTADIIGDYDFTLMANDGKHDSPPFIGTVKVSHANSNNQAPVAKANWEQPTPVLREISLSAQASSDANNDTLSYHWTLVSKPNGSASVLLNTHQSIATLTPDKLGDYTFSLTVNDGKLNSLPISHTITATNIEPIAAVKESIAGAVGQAILLDASESSDADGHNLTHHWQLLDKPANSTTAFTQQTGEKINFYADVFGDYSFQLWVDDGATQSESVKTTVAVYHTFTPLDFWVSDAAYSSSLERVVIVSADSQAMYTYSPVDHSLTQLALAYAPRFLSLSPDGLFAAIGNNGMISYVDLSTNSLVKTLTASTNFSDLVLDGTDIHTFLWTDGIQHINSINIATELETPTSFPIYKAYGPKFHLHPNGSNIYSIISARKFGKFDIGNGSVSHMYDSDDSSTFSVCHKLWITEDGKRLLTGCGNTFKSSTAQSVDMTYNGSLESFNSHIVNLAQAIETDKIAVLATDPAIGHPGGGGDPLTDTKIQFYNYEFLTYEKSVELPAFTVAHNSFPAHGKHVFFNDNGSQYLVIAQADSASGLLQDYGIFTSASPDALGSINQAPTAEAGMPLAVILGNTINLDGNNSSDVNGDILTYAWEIVEAPSASFAALNNPNSPNPTLVPDRAGAYTLALTVNDGQLNSLVDTVSITAVSSVRKFLFGINHAVLDAEYSKSLDRIVSISSHPNALYTFDTNNYQQTRVLLPLPPTAVSISPDGLFAAVSHDGWISHIDLTNNLLLKSTQLSTTASDIVLAGNGYAHVFSSARYSNSIYSVNLSTGEQTLSSNAFISAKSQGRLHPNGISLYGTDYRFTPKYNISTGPAIFDYDAPYQSDDRTGGKLWFSEDGTRIFTRSAHVYVSSTDQSQDMLYKKAIEQKISHSIISLSHSSAADRILTIANIARPNVPYSNTDIGINIYYYYFGRYDSYSLLNTIPFPKFKVNSNEFLAHGKFVFYNRDGTRYFAIVQADAEAGLHNDFAISVH